MCQTTIFSCGHSVFRDCGLPKKPAGSKPKLEGQWWESKTLPVPKRNVVCPGIVEPPNEVKVPCYKCVTDDQAKVKRDNAEASQEKMRERRGAGNDNYMQSLALGNNYDEEGQFICDKPENFVYLDMLGKYPWDSLAYFDKVGKMRDRFGYIVDRLDITPEQKGLQVKSAICIAQRNSSMKVEELGSVNPAYMGMTSRFIAELDPPTVADAASDGGSDNFALPNNEDEVEYDSPVTDFFDYVEGSASMSTVSTPSN